MRVWPPHHATFFYHCLPCPLSSRWVRSTQCRQGTHTVRYPMSTFYASKDEKVAAAGKAHNAALRKRYPAYDDQLRALNLNIRLALVGDAQVYICTPCVTYF